MNERIIKLNDTVVSLQCTSEFMNIVARHFSLVSVDEVTDNHLREYVALAIKNAVEKEVKK
jgi:hypothetical protein